MSDKFVIQGGSELKGEIHVMGAKNAAGPLIAATLLTDEECILSNVPKVADILNLLDIVEGMGKEIKWVDNRTVSIKGNGLDCDKMDAEKVSKSRVSVLLMGALLARVREFKIYLCRR